MIVLSIRRRRSVVAEVEGEGFTSIVAKPSKKVKEVSRYTRGMWLCVVGARSGSLRLG